MRLRIEATGNQRVSLRLQLKKFDFQGVLGHGFGVMLRGKGARKRAFWVSHERAHYRTYAAMASGWM